MPCHPDRDRRDKPGDDAMSFASVSFCRDLVCVTRDLFFSEGSAFFSAAVVTALPVLGCRGGFEAVRAGGSEWAGSAISNPNRAATSPPSPLFPPLPPPFFTAKPLPAPA